MKKLVLLSIVLFTVLVNNVSAQTVYITNTGKRYHRAGCQYLSRSCHAIDLKDAIDEGYTPCKVCCPPTTISRVRSSGKYHTKSQNLPCDTPLWQHVYHKYRLHVIEECKTVTGTVISLRKEKDGDYHIRLQLDPGQGSLINEKNIEAQKGCLVIEIICANEVTQQDASGACSDYVNHIPIPEQGQHIKVTGCYVLDTQHGWNEIHPVTKIEELLNN